MTSVTTEVRIEGRTVALRAFCLADLSSTYVGWLNDPVVTRFSNQRFTRHTVETCTDYWRTFEGTDHLFLAICPLSGGMPIGSITAYIDTRHQTADMGILVGDREFWGKGVGLDAWRTLGDWLFSNRGLRKITGGTVSTNIAMSKLMTSYGMHLEATLTAQQIVEGQPADVLCYAKFLNE